MGLAHDYVEAIKSVGKVVEGIHDKMAPYCMFHDRTTKKESFSYKCLYKGRTMATPCAREICPLLEKE